MKNFMDKDFCLASETARTLFHDYASKMPIIDYHCHLSPKEIWEDRRFNNITEVWLGGDHYKWRLMRANGVDEKYITGDAPDHDKFIKYAETLEKCIGNPVHQWSHLELKTYFGFNEALSSKTAEKVWKLCNEKLADPAFSARGIMKMSNVKLVCTTDDPVDSLEYHEKIKADESFDIQVLPAWRPDKIINIEKPDFADYVNKLAKAADTEIVCIKCVKRALKARLDFFAAHGCKLADHGIDYVPYEPCTEAEASEIFKEIR